MWCALWQTDGITIRGPCYMMSTKGLSHIIRKLADYRSGTKQVVIRDVSVPSFLTVTCTALCLHCSCPRYFYIILTPPFPTVSRAETRLIEACNLVNQQKSQFITGVHCRAILTSTVGLQKCLPHLFGISLTAAYLIRCCRSVNTLEILNTDEQGHRADMRLPRMHSIWNIT